MTAYPNHFVPLFLLPTHFRTVISAARFKEAFGVIDQDHDTVIDENDLREMLASLGASLPAKHKQHTYTPSNLTALSFP